MSKKARIKRKMRRHLTALVKSESLTVDEFASAIKDNESAFDQPCAFGLRCGSHAVYCNNLVIPLPRKCRQTWWHRDMSDAERRKERRRDEDCPGFLPNPRGDR